MILLQTLFNILIPVSVLGINLIFNHNKDLSKTLEKKCDRKELKFFRDELSMKIMKLEEDVKNIFSATNVNQTNIKSIKDDVHLILQRLQ